MSNSLRSLAGSRAIVWLSLLVLLAGVIAFVTVRIGSGDASTPQATPPETSVDGTNYTPGEPTTPQAKVADVPKAARVVAGEFILAAVGREDLSKAWRLSHPDLKAQCGCTYKQWLSGNIPIQPFPTSGLQGVSYAVDELQPRQVVLQTLLRPKPGSEVGDRAFYLGLKAVGSGSNVKWLVDYWAPIATPPVPLNPS